MVFLHGATLDLVAMKRVLMVTSDVSSLHCTPLCILRVAFQWLVETGQKLLVLKAEEAAKEFG